MAVNSENLMDNGPTLKLLVAIALASGVATVRCPNAARAAAGDTSTTAAAASATSTISPPAQAPRWLGVAMEKIPPVFSHLLGLKPQQGLMVLQVIPNSPAFKAHVQPGDLLITLNGRALESPFELIRAENQRGPTAPALNITLIHAGVRKAITLTPVDRPHHLVFFFNRRLGPVGALPPGTGSPDGIQATSLMTVGPGVKLHIPAAGIPQSGNGRPDLVTLRQWIGPHGGRHLQILWRSRAYNIQPHRLNRLPPPVRAVARLILQSHSQSITPAPSRYMLIQRRLTEVKAMIHNLQLQEKSLETQALKCAPPTPAK